MYGSVCPAVRYVYWLCIVCCSIALQHHQFNRRNVLFTFAHTPNSLHVDGTYNRHTKICAYSFHSACRCVVNLRHTMPIHMENSLTLSICLFFFLHSILSSCSIWGLSVCFFFSSSCSQQWQFRWRTEPTVWNNIVSYAQTKIVFQLKQRQQNHKHVVFIRVLHSRCWFYDTRSNAIVFALNRCLFIG